jgi:hypothetical protein
MSRMYDRILAQGLGPPWWVNSSWDREFRDFQKMILPVLPNAQVFAIDNVCEYCYRHMEQEFWTLGDLPNLAPPFPAFFMETRRPRQMLHREGGKYQLAPFDLDWDGWGVLVMGSESETVDATAPWLPYVQCDEEMAPAQQCGGSTPSQVSPIGGIPKWHLVAILLVEERRGRIVGPVVIWDFQVDSNGAACSQPRVIGAARPDDVPESEFWAGMSDVSALLYPAFLSISFLHCKNIRVERQTPPQKLSRAFRRRHGRPLTRFHTLQITPMKQVLEREGQSESIGLKKALHICRGHFKTFTPEHKLFGRYTGTYWWAAHVRGTIEQGIALKDYAVNQPASPTASPDVSDAA